MRNVLHVKPTSSNIIVLGEVGKFPPSVYSQIYTMCYVNRLHHMDANRIPKHAYNELVRLGDIGLNNWTTDAFQLVKSFNIDIELSPDVFKVTCKKAVFTQFLIKWHNDCIDIQSNPILRMYSLIKSVFETSPHLLHVRDSRYRDALSKLRASSHTLEIERGRHQGIARHDRLCHKCCVIESELHFVLYCKINQLERDILFEKMSTIDSCFVHRNDKFDILMTNRNAQILTWFGKFIHKSFGIRQEYFKSNSV